MSKRLQVGACLGPLILESDLEFLAGLRRSILPSARLGWGVDPLQALLETSQLTSWSGQALAGFFDHPETLRQALGDERLVVSLVDDYPPQERYAAVSLDQLAAGTLAARHLAEFCPERFLFLGHDGRSGAEQRRQGYRAELLRLGAVPPEELIIPFAARNDDLTAILRPWLEERKTDKLGIFCSSDRLAARVLAAALELQLGVPEKIQILGCGNITVVCELCDLPISSVIMPWRRLGECAGDALSRLAGGEAPEPLSLPPLGIEVRASSDPDFHSDPVIQAALRVIRSRACDGLGIDELCREIQVGRRTLERRFAVALGRSIRDEIERIRFQRAGELLRASDWNLARIAKSCGLGSARSLHDLFLRRGLPPPGANRS